MNTYGGGNFNLNELYIELVEDIFNNGTILTKKNGTVLKEIVPATIEIKDPYSGILLHPYRNYNPAFMIAECLWNLCGDVDDWLADYNEIYRKYFYNKKLRAGYGNRIFNGKFNQLIEVRDLLKEHPDSSRGTISIFNPLYDYKETNFVPCISFLKFRILGDGKLYMWSFMRAQDIWKGFPYDIFLLLSIFQYMSKLLNVQMGSYYHVCDTIRLYQDDFEDIEIFLKNTKFKTNPEKIELCDYKQINDNQILNFRNLVRDNDFDMNLLSNFSDFWKDAILTCWVYKNIKMKNFDQAIELLYLIKNGFKEQIITWSQRYDKKFLKELEKHEKKDL